MISLSSLPMAGIQLQQLQQQIQIQQQLQQQQQMQLQLLEQPVDSTNQMVTKTKKVFIGGLSASSTLEDMKSYFEQYGKVEDAMLMFDKATQRHRGFGFITFDNDEVSDKVCEIHFHEINGKMVECKKAQPKEVMLPVQLNKSRAAAARNLYGLPPEQLLAYASYLPRIYANGMPYHMFNQLPMYGAIPSSPGSSTGARTGLELLAPTLYGGAASAAAGGFAPHDAPSLFMSPQSLQQHHNYHNKV